VSGQTDAPRMGLAQRLWVYQAERFPLGKTALLLGVFTSASLSLSAHLAGRPLPPVWTFIAIWLVAITLFFQLRACDEYKDLEDDRRYRPERPIPRGLVSLRLVLSLAAGSVLLAVLLSISVHPLLLVPLALVWLWLGLMTAEFLVPAWLKARPFAYLVSHMAIMAFIDFYVTAGEWLPHDPLPPAGIWLFVVLSCVNGCILEFGRKTWAPESEREGVETYSALLGPRRAAFVLASLCITACVLLAIIGGAAGATWIAAVLGILALIPVLAIAWWFTRAPTDEGQKRVDLAAGLWVFACYAIAGFSPYLGSLIR
jgi:4-hydroxybenzoate polyprenyltransferase